MAARRAHDVAPRQAEEPAAGRQIADVQLIALGRIVDVDVPVVHAAVDFDVADGLPGRGGRAVAEHLAQPQHRPRPVPILPQSDLRPLDALAAEFPVGVQPVGIADHDHQAILDVPTALDQRPEGQVFGLGELALDLFQALVAVVRGWGNGGCIVVGPCVAGLPPPGPAAKEP